MFEIQASLDLKIDRVITQYKIRKIRQYVLAQKYLHGIYFGRKLPIQMNSDNSIGRSEDDEHAKTLEMTKIKKEIEKADEIFYDELASKYSLLNKFSVDQLRETCTSLLGKGPDVEYFHDERTNKSIELPQYKEDFIHFIIDEFSFAEIKDYALKNNILESHFLDDIE